MKRNLHIELIRDFILQKPGRQFEEIVVFLKEIDGTFDELKEAIFEIALSPNFLNHPSIQLLKERVNLIEATNRKVKKLKKTQIAIIFAVFSLLCLLITWNLVYQKTLRSENFLQKDKIQALIAPDSLSPQNLKAFASPIFINQSRLDSKKIFSYPASSVTLKFLGTPKKEVLGFFPYWMLDSWDKINISGLTSISLFGLETDGNGNIITASDNQIDEGWAMWRDERLDSFIERARKARIKIFLTMKSFNNSNIESLVSNNESHKKFIANTIQLVSSKGLSGVNIDFEYTGEADAQTISAFVRLIGNLSSELDRQLPESKLTVDTYIKSGAELDFFDIELLSEFVDSFVVMGYDIHTPKGNPGPIAPLEGESSILGFVQSYLERVDSDKIILGVPYYGYSWPISAEASAGKPVEVKTLPYAEIVANSKSYKISWNETSKTPYYQYIDSGTNYEVHFENTRSLGLKYDFVNQKNLKGIAIWAMGYEGSNSDLSQLILDKFAK